MHFEERVARSVLPRHEARRLAAAAVRADDPSAEFARLEGERLAGEPLQYLEGSAPFGPLDLAVDHRVLIPRPETEQLWELSRELAPQPSVVLDLCTGSGALALAWKSVMQSARVVGADLSEPALEVARANSAALGLDVEWLAGDLFGPLPADLLGRIDLIVCNPPYVAEDEWASLPEDVRREPRAALVSGPDGLGVLRRLAAECADWLAPGGWMISEIGEAQGKACAEMFGARLQDVEIRPDLAGRDRFVMGRRL